MFAELDDQLEQPVADERSKTLVTDPALASNPPAEGLAGAAPENPGSFLHLRLVLINTVAELDANLEPSSTDKLSPKLDADKARARFAPLDDPRIQGCLFRI